jgi:tetratricopeptide (TPR) repeat protein
MNRQQRRAERRHARHPSPSVQSLLAAAVQHHQAGRLDQAEPLYRQVLTIDPTDPDGLHLLGVIAYQTGRADLSIDMIARAIAIRATEASYHCNLGVALKQLGRIDDAVACYRRAIELRPDYPEAHSSLGNALGEQGWPEEAIACYRRAIEFRPDYPEAHYNLGITLREQGDVDAAVACYRNSIDLRPDYQEAHYNLANALRDQRHLDEAVASYRAAIRLAPDFPDAHHNLALALLARGDLAEGWAEYEWRWRTRDLISARRDFAQPLWHGEPAEGRTLLLHAEQGSGDTLQFCRFAALAKARGARVIMEVQKPLVRLLRGLTDVDQVSARGEVLPAFDLHCPMLSLPLALGTTLATIPNAAPYIQADETQLAAWRMRMMEMSGHGLRVGVAWAGAAANTADQRRSIAPERLAPLFEVSGVSFLSLQKDGPADPAVVPLIDVMGEMDDFCDTAALIANLDLVISVDTAVAHLAAAMGKPVWLLDRFDACWRWLAGRRDSPWYPSLRIYRQPQPGDWDSVLGEVAHDLRNMIEVRYYQSTL